MSRTAAFVWSLGSLVALAGCASIAGLDSIQECPNCFGEGGATDATVDAAGDGASGDDTTGDDSSTSGDGDASTVDSSMKVDSSTHDSSTVDSSKADTGGGVDAAPDTSTLSDSGCGSTSTVQNCGACGQACASTPSSTTQSASCNGTTCSYTCKPGNLDCNASIGYDPDGCECPVVAGTYGSTQCCAAGNCPIQHNYDTQQVGTTFYDCTPSGTYSQTLAADACHAYAGASAQCTSYTCTYVDGGAIAGDMVCSDGTSTPNCACWGYDYATKGYMLIGSGSGSSNCGCPDSTNSPWN